MEFWKTLIAPTLVAIITGFVFFEAGRLTAPEVPNIQVSVSSLSIPNPLVGRDTTSLISEAQKLLGYSDLDNNLKAYLHFHSDLYLGIIHIENKSDVKSKKIVIFADRSTLFSPGANPSSNKIELPPLDPQTETNVYCLGESPIYPWSDVRVMHDDRRIDVLFDDGSYKSIDRFFEKYGLLAYMISAFAIVSTVLVILSLINGVVSSVFSVAKSQSTSKSDQDEVTKG
jgi:hypothetical protein